MPSEYRADPPVPGELDERQRLVDARVRQPGGRGEHPQVVAAAAGGMEVAGLEHRPDPQRGPFEGRVRAAEDERLAGRRRGQPEQDAQRGALARPVRPEEPGHGPGRERERDVVDGDERAVALAQRADADDLGHRRRIR